ncbi:hypothetical protein [Halorubellus sp. PRR65]|uniref:hypothetical protein n=1 Tax=Halorubellus sp. PRR65 TaxID=3098148 RepID=UPI002B25C966|nr:hypothetical protein [Halorubellus sp. PRR65]
MTNHVKAGAKKGGIKDVAKGGAAAVGAGGAAVLGGAALTAVGAAALVGMAAGFGAGAAKSVGMERLKDWNRDYTTMEGITNEAPKDIGNIADNIGDFVTPSGGDEDIEKATKDTSSEGGDSDGEFESEEVAFDDETETEENLNDVEKKTEYEN